MAVIRNKAGIALLGTSTLPETISALQEIRGETERLSQLISDLLNLARGDEGQVPFEREAVHLDILVEIVIATADVLANERGIQLDVRVREKKRRSNATHRIVTFSPMEWLSVRFDTGGEVKSGERHHRKDQFSLLGGEYKPPFVLEQNRTSLRKSTSPPVSDLVIQELLRYFWKPGKCFWREHISSCHTNDEFISPNLTESHLILTFTHIEPHHLDGSSELENLQLLCNTCNVTKGMGDIPSATLRKEKGKYWVIPLSVVDNSDYSPHRLTVHIDSPCMDDPPRQAAQVRTS